MASESAETGTGVPHGHDMAIRGRTVLKSRDAGAARRLKSRTESTFRAAGYEIGESRKPMAESLTSRPTRTSRLCTHSAWWLLARHRDSQTEVLTLTHGGAEMLPVFSFREEAEMYLLSEKSGEDWQARGIGAGELVAVLSGPCPSVQSVALDPLPSMADEVAELVSLDRERFVSRVVRGAA